MNGETRSGRGFGFGRHFKTGFRMEEINELCEQRQLRVVFKIGDLRALFRPFV